MMPAPLEMDIPAEITERRQPERVIREWLDRHYAECPRADGCVATEAELREMLDGDDPERVILDYARSLTPSSGESGDHGPAGAQ